MQIGVKISAGNDMGVTLIELLVVMAIIGIIVLVGVNMMGGVISKQRLRTAAGEAQSRLRVAQMLAVVRNAPITVVFDTTNDEYYACISQADGTCTTEFINLDSGRSSSQALATKELNPMVDLYGVNFGVSTTNAVTFMPPSGLPRRFEDASSNLINGATCFKVEAGEEDDDFKDRWVFRRVSVDPLVGKATMWTNLQVVGGAAITNDPACEDTTPTRWEKVF